MFFIEKFVQNKKIGYGLGLIIISILIANLHVATWPFFFVLFLPYIAEYLLVVISDFIIYKKFKIFILKHKIKVSNKKNKDSAKIKKLESELKDLESKISKIKIKRETESKNAYKILIKKNISLN